MLSLFLVLFYNQLRKKCQKQNINSLNILFVPHILKEKIVEFVTSSSMNFFQFLLKSRSAYRQHEDHTKSKPQASRQILLLFYLYI